MLEAGCGHSSGGVRVSDVGGSTELSVALPTWRKSVGTRLIRALLRAEESAEIAVGVSYERTDPCSRCEQTARQLRQVCQTS